MTSEANFSRGNTSQIWVVTRHQYGISRGKPMMASRNFGCFFKLTKIYHKKSLPPLFLLPLFSLFCTVNRNFKIGHYGRQRRLDRFYVTQNTSDILSSSLWDGMLSQGFSSWRQSWNRQEFVRTYIVTCLLKPSTQRVKYALGCVYTYLPIGELKKKKRKRPSSFIRHNYTAWRLLVLESSAIVRENCRKER